MGIGLCETVYPMLEGPFARGHGGPQHGREVGVEGGQIAHHPLVDEFLEMVHLALIDQGVDHLPVGSIPADKEDFFCQRFHRRFLYLSNPLRWRDLLPVRRSDKFKKWINLLMDSFYSERLRFSSAQIHGSIYLFR